ncbi:MAG TPA: Trm112 family protein [Terracidiphilus sp.]
MSADPNASHQSPTLLQSVLDQLACPACHGTLRAEENKLTCNNCAHMYPILDGIPVLIAERTDKSAEATRDIRMP